MPYTGKPSGACSNCKQRHLKCDETTPACKRCLKANRICPGYAQGLDLVLRDQNEAAKASVSRRQNASQKGRPFYPESVRVSPRVDSTALVSCHLPETEDARSTCFFISSWVFHVRDPLADRGILELLPAILSTSRADSPLVHCVAAVSSCMFTKWEYRFRDAETPKVRRLYTKALSATSSALQDPIECLSDETLMAVCLLGFYEAAIASYQGHISNARHFDGAAALINHCQHGGNRSRSELYNKMLLGIRSNLVYRAIQNASSISKSDAIWQDRDETSHNPATLLDLMSVEVANTLAVDKNHDVNDKPLHKISDPSFGPLAHTLSTATHLDQWPLMVPLSWHPAKVLRNEVPDAILEAGFYGESCDVYSDVMICSTWNDWRVARLKMLALIARQSSGAVRTGIIQAIQQHADEICASIPFSLGSRVNYLSLFSTEVVYPMSRDKAIPTSHSRSAAAYGGWYLLCPMREILNVERHLRPGQGDWVRDQLQRLAKAYDVHPEE